MHRPGPGRVELDLPGWEAAARQALAAAVDRSGVAPVDWLGITVTGPARGAVLLDAAGAPLLAVGADDERGLPQLLAGAARLLPLSSWLTWRLGGAQVVEVTAACATGLADVAARDWVEGRGSLPPVVESGTVVGELGAGWALPATLPVVTGCEEPLACSAGSGGLADGVLTVLPGGRAVATVPAPLVLPGTVTTAHAVADRWAVVGAPQGLQQALGPYAVVVSCGGFGVRRTTVADAVARAGSWLVERAVGAHTHPPGLPG